MAATCGKMFDLEIQKKVEAVKKIMKLFRWYQNQIEQIRTEQNEADETKASQTG
jgi:hypothetical protein